MKKYSDIIRGLREDSKLKQPYIAKLIGVSQQQYSKYERGDAEPSLYTLKLLADYYGVSTDYILGRTSRKEGVVGTGEMITSQYSAGEVISEVAMLTPERRKTVVDFILFLKSCELAKQKK
jgi:transcriptional regulator with XRE-family HTH domain